MKDEFRVSDIPHQDSIYEAAGFSSTIGYGDRVGWKEKKKKKKRRRKMN